MAANMGRIRAILTLNAAQFGAALRNAQAQLRTFSNRVRAAFGIQGSANNAAKSVNTVTNSLKDMQRIVGGILVAQAFYQIAAAARDASAAVLTFSNNMQVAAVTLQYFVGSADRAREFLVVMQEFAAVTPFSSEQAIALSRRLMAMGFVAEQTKAVMTVLTDTAAATGGTAEQLDRVVLALGQMKTNGYIAGQELRQLAEAGIPVYKILAQELGLIPEQLAQIGDLKISGDLGVEAVLRGLERRYKGAAAQIAMTMPGLVATIKDNMLVLTSELFAGMYEMSRGYIKIFRDWTESAVDTLRKNGIGGVLEETFSPLIMKNIRLIIGGIDVLRQSIMAMVIALRPALEMTGGLFLGTIATITTTLATLARHLAAATAAALETWPALQLVFTGIASLFIANAVSKSLIFLWRVLGLGMIASAVATAVERLVGALKALSILLLRNPILLLLSAAAASAAYMAISMGMADKAIDNIYNSFAKLAGIDVGSILQPVQQPTATNTFNQALETTGDSLKDVGKNAAEAGKKVKNAFTASFDEIYNIPEKVEDTADAFKEFNPSAELALPEIDPGNMGIIPMPGMPNMSAVSSLTQTLSESLKSSLAQMFRDIGDSIVGFFVSLPGEIWRVLKNAFNNLVEGLKLIWGNMSTSFSDTWSTLWTGIKNIGSNLWGLVTSSFNSMVTGLRQAWETFSTVAQEVWTLLWTWVKDTSVGLWDAVSTAFGVFVGAALEIWGAIKTGVEETWGAVWKWVSEKAGEWWNTLTKDFDTMVKGLGELWNALVTGIPENWDRIWTAVSTKATEWWTALTEALDTTIQGLTELWDSLVTGVGENWNTLWTGVKNKGDEWWGKIDSALDTTATGLKDIWTTLTTETETSWSTLWTNAKSVGDEQWGLIKGALGVTSEDMKTIWTGLKTSIEDTWTTVWTWVETEGGTLWGKVETAFTGAKDRMVGIWENLREGTKEVFKNLAEDIKGVLNGIIDKVNTMTAAIGNIKIDIPSVNIPGMGTIGGGTLSLPKLPQIPRLERGGIVNRHTLVEIGEKDRREAVVPLDNSAYMRPFSNAVAEDLAELLGNLMPQQSYGGAGSDKPILYVGNLIADDRGLKELYRRMEVIAIQENQRKGM